MHVFAGERALTGMRVKRSLRGTIASPAGCALPKAIYSAACNYLLAFFSILFTQLDGRACGLSCPTLPFLFLPDC